MKILIVDDNPRVRWLIKTILEDMVDQFYECADGEGALEAYAALRPDWVLMDIKMTQMDGIVATRQITTAFADARVMIVTDYDDADLRDAATGAGACGYLVKEELHSLRRILKTKQI